MKPSISDSEDYPLKIVGGNKYGRYPKISDEKTYNMIVSDNWLVPFSGFKALIGISDETARGLFTSVRLNKMVAVFGNRVYFINPNITADVYYEINTYSGDVFIDENYSKQIAICDQSSIWIYDYSNATSPTFTKATKSDASPLPFVPGYVTFQNGRFVAPGLNSPNWYLSNVGNGKLWDTSLNSAQIQTKPDIAVATLRAPGRSDLLYVFGETVTELWNDIGGALFPYQKTTTLNIDYGCVSSATIASNENTVAWLAQNERSGPVIMVMTGGEAKRISNDGIDFLLARLVDPGNSYGYFLRQDGHLFYILTFADVEDNLTLMYDFNTEMFFNLSDQDMDHFPAQRVAFFNDKTYFVSFTDGKLFELSTEYTTYDYTISGERSQIFEIPRIRTTPPIRQLDSSRFRVNSLTFTVEQGNDPYYKGNIRSFIATQSGSALVTQSLLGITTQIIAEPYVPRIDLCASRDGAETFGSNISYSLNSQGKRVNRVIFWQLGAANDLTLQLRFWAKGRVLASDGIVSVYP